LLQNASAVFFASCGSDDSFTSYIKSATHEEQWKIAINAAKTRKKTKNRREKTTKRGKRGIKVKRKGEAQGV
jgi:hypothetical protein